MVLPLTTSPHPPGRAPMHCEQHSDLRDGCLNAEQRLRWTGTLPGAAMRDRLPGAFDRIHFAAVESSVLGAMRCRVTDDAVECRLIGLWPALRFSDPESRVEARRVLRRWRIAGGGLARRAEIFGSITFGWELENDEPASPLQTPGAAHRPEVEQVLWVRVEGYPSRFLAPPPHRPWYLPGAVSSLYAWYHGVVTCRYLRRMALWMARNDPGEAPPGSEPAGEDAGESG